MAIPSNASELLSLREVEHQHILKVLAACGGNRTDAARVLGVDRKTLYRRLLRAEPTSA